MFSTDAMLFSNISIGCWLDMWMGNPWIQRAESLCGFLTSSPEDHSHCCLPSLVSQAWTRAMQSHSVLLGTWVRGSMWEGWRAMGLQKRVFQSASSSSSVSFTWNLICLSRSSNWDTQIYFFIYLAVLEFELRAYILSSPIFVVGIFKIDTHKLFAHADFEPWSSWSLPP
jgi:hypothetical protein